MTIAEKAEVRAIYVALEASERTVARLQRENGHLRDVIAWLLAPWYGKLWIRARQWWRERQGGKA